MGAPLPFPFPFPFAWWWCAAKKPLPLPLATGRGAVDSGVVEVTAAEYAKAAGAEPGGARFFPALAPEAALEWWSGVCIPPSTLSPSQRSEASPLPHEAKERSRRLMPARSTRGFLPSRGASFPRPRAFARSRAR